jgi:hypothetical protein
MSNLQDPNSLLLAGGLLVVILAFVGGAAVIWKTDSVTDIEVLKARFAQVTFVGIFVLVLFTAILYYVVDPKTAGKDIFDKVLTAITPLAGVIIGYFFSTRQSDKKDDADKTGNKEKPSDKDKPSDKEKPSDRDKPSDKDKTDDKDKPSDKNKLSDKDKPADKAT